MTGIKVFEAKMISEAKRHVLKIILDFSDGLKYDFNIAFDNFYDLLFECSGHQKSANP